MTYCTVNIADIYYEEIGQGTPIIMIHGYSPDHRLMKGCMEPIFNERHGWRRIYIDLPGMGLTRDYDGIKCSDDMVGAVHEFIQTVIPDQKYVIAGESYGGYLTNGLIHKDEHNILGAAFICPVIKPNHQDRTVPEHEVLKIDENFISTLSQNELEDFRSNNVVLNKSTWERYNNEIISGIRVADHAFLDRVQESYGFSFEIGQSVFAKPSLFLLGKQDATVGYRDALELEDKYPRGTFVVVDQAGHNLQIEQPGIFNALVEDWLERMGTGIC
ncbi:alpha/beta fold hydrolase [Rossellomorea marisflavi]|uniref:alpha/beta fold hydrolase n=2 Tax=Rossellomorea marisflavi TaxID=189381 RepID=UPI0013175AAA|nr:alpha/beta hydrolase [Rossellomorea marisflavi]QHA38358.1 alpha/beta fold hydrolase [Rossellomorea marisflavi]